MNWTKYTVAVALGLLISCGEKDSKNMETESAQKDSVTPAETEMTKFSVESLSKKQLPKGLTFDGNVMFIKKYVDNSGEHIVLLTETGVIPSKKIVNFEGENDAKIYAYDFLMEKGTEKQTWKIHDFITNCEFDLLMDFKEKAFQITDLNKNGIAEIWTMYSMTCTSDVSPSELKLIMYEGDKKHAMRGYTLVDIGNNEKMGGEFKLDENFNSSGKEIQDYAKKLWKENCM